MKCLLIAMIWTMTQQDVTSPVEGRITQEEPQQRPVANAVVELQGPSFNLVETKSDASGNFRFRNVPPGMYRLKVRANGFVAAEYGQRAYYLPGTPLNIEAGKKIEPILIRLTPTGGVSGRVVGGDGESLPGVLVSLSKWKYRSDGRKYLSIVAAVRTDDLGTYRLFFITPDEYVISFEYGLETRTDSLFPINLNEESFRPGYVPTFYPGVANPNQAVIFRIASGDELQLPVFWLRPVPVARVAGTVLNSETGRAVQARVLLSNSREAQSDETGKFEFGAVPSGSYAVFAFRESDNLSGQQSFQVFDKDVSNLSLRLQSNLLLRGRVYSDSPTSMVDFSRITVSLSGASDSVALGETAYRMQRNGSFELQILPSVRYRITVLGLPETFFVKAIKFGGRDAPSNEIDIGSEIRDSLDILISDQGAQVNGRVQTSPSEPVAGALAVLVPEEKLPGMPYRTSVSGRDGQFSLKGIPPGKYVLFAWAYIEDGAYYDREFLRRFEDRGIPLEVRTNQTVTVQIPALLPDRN